MTLKELKAIRTKEELNLVLKKYNFTYTSIFNKGNSLLHLAVYSGNFTLVKLVRAQWLELAGLESWLTLPNEKEESAQQLAYRLGFQDIFMWFRDAKANPELTEAPDHWADYFKILKAVKINTKSNWTTYRGQEIRIKSRVEHHRGSALKHSHMLARHLNLNYDFKIPKFLTTPVRWYHQFYNWLGVFLSNTTKEYPWKKLDLSATHPYVDCYYTKLSPEIGRQLKQKARQIDSNPVALFCAITDQVFQAEFLTKPVTTDNLLTLNITSIPEPRHPYHTEVSVLPFKISAEPNLYKKSRKIASQLKWGILLKTFLRADYEVKLFNYLFKKKPDLINKFISGRQSRFITYSYFGDFKVSPEVYEHDFIGLGRSTPMMKISLAFHFKNDDLVISLDINSQILPNRSEHTRILNNLKAAIEQAVTPN